MLQKKFWSVSNRFSVKLVQSVGGILGIADYRSSLDILCEPNAKEVLDAGIK